MRHRRIPTRAGALSNGAPLDVLTATVSRAADPPPTPVERAARTGAALAVVPSDWHWPRWLDRQLRAGHPAQIPVGDLGLVENVTARDWRALGTVSSGPLAVVDARGLVSPINGGWSIDWLIGADDRWYRPAHEAGVRQRLIGGAPVVETACRVPGGDVVQRAYAAHVGGEAGDAVIIEVENQTPVPVAVAFAVRPADVLGAGSISALAFDDNRIFVDGRPVLLLERRPARWASGDYAADSIRAVVSGHAGDDFAQSRCSRGLAQAAFVVPVAHRTSLRFFVFPNAARRDRPPSPASVASAGAVARGWDAHVERAARIELPDRRLVDAYAGAVRTIVLATATGTPSIPTGREERWGVADEVRIVRALAHAGLTAVATSLLRGRCEELELDSWFRRESPSLARNNAIFDAVATCWRLGGDRAAISAVVGPVVKAAHWNERYRARNHASIKGPEAYISRDALAGLALALGDVAQADAAQDIAAFAARFVLDLDEQKPPNTEATEVMVSDRRGIDTLATIDRAVAFALAGDERALQAAVWLAEVAGTQWRWPTFVHPRLGSGSAGSGDDSAVAAAIIEFVRAFVVREQPRSLALLPVVPQSWYGQSVDVHDLPTASGTLSFALRWHGARPALLWELEPFPNMHEEAEVALSAPSLDPTFHTTRPKGDALLAAPTKAAVEPGTAFS